MERKGEEEGPSAQRQRTVDEDVGAGGKRRGALIARKQQEGPLFSLPPSSVSPVVTCRPLKSLKIHNVSSVTPNRF